MILAVALKTPPQNQQNGNSGSGGGVGKRHPKSLPKKRQTPGGGDSSPSFVGGGDPNPSNCSAAITFSVSDGLLVDSTGALLTTDPGVLYQRLLAGTMGTITTEFVLTPGGPDGGQSLSWNNAAFVNGSALFCQTSDGLVWVVFQGLANGPANCVVIDLVALPARRCVGGVLLPDPDAIPTTTSAGAGGGTQPTGGGGGGGGGNQTLSLDPSFYFSEEPGAMCFITTESWYVGESTFIAHSTSTTATP